MIPATYSIVQRLPRNTRGRDFVVGDIHGALGLVQSALQAVRFDAGDDRLFSTGDWVDRGEASKYCLQMLNLPFVHSVRGNHEQMALGLFDTSGEFLEQDDPAVYRNGMEWWLELTPAQRVPLLNAFNRLPFAIEVETARGTVGIIHADVPSGLAWPEFVAQLEAGNSHTMQTCLWGRHRIQSEVESGVPGVGRVFVGHTPQWGGLGRYGNVYAVDTGAVFGQHEVQAEGALTMANMCTGTGSMTMPRKAVNLLNVLDEPTPQWAFGQGPGYTAPPASPWFASAIRRS